ncbi:MAG: outer membrane protein assembly factor BamE [Sulfuricaulis sp.]
MNTKTMRHVLLLAAILQLSGCLNVYRLEIQQGNVVTQEMIDQLKPGLTRSQVRYVLGTPLVTDPFHPDRWDYYYYLRRSNEKAGDSRHLTVFFKNDLLVTVHGDTRIKLNNSPATEPDTKPTGATPAPLSQPGTKLEPAAPRVL